MKQSTKNRLKAILWVSSVTLYAAIQISAQSITVKDTPASSALVNAAKELATEQKSYDTLLSQAKSSMGASAKQIQSELQKEASALNMQLKDDPKYKDQVAKIEGLQKQLQQVGQTASQKFNQESAPIQNEIGKNKALIDGLIPVVRKESGLPDTATFDSTTQTWKTTPAKK